MLIETILKATGHGCVTAGRNETVGGAVRVLAERDIGAVVVIEAGGAVAGIFSERDLVRLVARDGGAALDRPLGDAMTSPVVTCRPDDTVDQVLAIMTARRIRHAPVIGPDGLTGMVGIRDLVRSRLGEKELEAAVLLDISRLHG